jgi:putative membrane protein
MIQALYFFKALHVVGFVAWFAGMFYLVRMFVYHEEAYERPAPEDGILKKQFNLMEWRVYRIICNPAMMITWTAGITMLILGIVSPLIPNYLSPDMGTPGWMHFKLLLLVLLTVYHLWCKRIIKRMEAGERPFTSWQYRLLNEMPTLFLILITFSAVYGKTGSLNYFYLFGGLILFIGLLFWGARAYKRARAKSDKNKKLEVQTLNSKVRNRKWDFALRIYASLHFWKHENASQESEVHDIEHKSEK